MDDRGHACGDFNYDTAGKITTSSGSCSNDINDTPQLQHEACAMKTTPLYALRKGYLWVSDLLSQAWCEQQMFYKFTVPTVVEVDPAMKAGTDLHLARGQANDNYQTNLSYICPMKDPGKTDCLLYNSTLYNGTLYCCEIVYHT